MQLLNPWKRTLPFILLGFLFIVCFLLHRAQNTSRAQILKELSDSTYVCESVSFWRSRAHKHAYLILAHHMFKHLELLLKLLDHPKNDIYVLIDKKVSSPPIEDLKRAVTHSRLVIIRSVTVNWAAYSEIVAEMELLKLSSKQYHDYYHLLSGVDLPLKTQKEIHEFFRDHSGKNFIKFTCRLDTCFKERIDQYWLLWEYIGRNNYKYREEARRLNRWLLRKQQEYNISRLHGCEDLFYKGAQWFSITHCMARYLLTKQNVIKKYFKYSHCGSEEVIQTLAWHSPLRNTITQYNMRLVDWKRGEPYTFRNWDFRELIQSDQLFARKFNITRDPKVVLQLYNYIIKREKELSLSLMKRIIGTVRKTINNTHTSIIKLFHRLVW